MDKKEVRKLCEKHGMLNPIYEWRSSLSCFCCPFQRLQDWKNLYIKHPNLFMIAEVWEEMSNQNSKGFGWRSDGWSLKAIRKNQSCQLSLFKEENNGY